MPPVSARRATAAVFVLNGFVLGMWVVNIPEILDRTEASQAELGGLLLIMGGAAFAGMQLAGRLVDHHGSRPVAVGGSLASCAALLGPAFVSGVGTLAVVLVAFGLANGAVDVAQNAHAVEVERAYARPVMSAFHAFFSLGGVAAAVVGGTFISAGLDLRVSVAIAAGAGVCVTLAARRDLLPRSTDLPPRQPGVRAPWTGRVLLLGLLAFALLLAEGVGYDWSTVHLHHSLDASTAVAAWAFGAFSITMTVGRLLADRVVARFGPAAFVRVAALAGGVGLTGAALAPNPPAAIVAWGLFGLALAGCTPQFFSAAGNVDPSVSGTYVARIAGLGYVGLLAGPASIGLLTAWVPLTTAFALPVGCCVLAGILAPRTLRPEKPEVP